MSLCWLLMESSLGGSHVTKEVAIESAETLMWDLSVGH